MIPTPVYTTEAHPIGVWQAWYSDNLAAIEDSSKYVFYGPLGQNDGSNNLRHIPVPFYPEWAGPLEGSGTGSGKTTSSTNSSANSASAAHDIMTVAIPTQPRTPRDTYPLVHTAANTRVYAPYEYTDSLNKRVCWTPYLLGSERQEFDSHLRLFMNYCRWANMRLRPAPQAKRGGVKTEVVVPISPKVAPKRSHANGNVLVGIGEVPTTATPDDKEGLIEPGAKRPSYGSTTSSYSQQPYSSYQLQPPYMQPPKLSFGSSSSSSTIPSILSSPPNPTLTPVTSTSSSQLTGPMSYQNPLRSQQPPLYSDGAYASQKQQPLSPPHPPHLGPPPPPGSQQLNQHPASPPNNPQQSPENPSQPQHSNPSQLTPVLPPPGQPAPGQPVQPYYSPYQNYYNLSLQNEFQQFEGE